MYRMSIKELLSHFIMNLKKVVAIFVSVFILLFSMFNFYYPSIYQNTILFVVNEKNLEFGNYNINNDFKLSSTYSNVILSDYIINQINEDQNISITKNNINDYLILSQDRNTKVFELKVKGNSSDEVKEISSNVKKVIDKEIPNILGEVEVNFISSNNEDYIKLVSPNPYLVIIASFWIAILVSVLYLIVSFVRNKKIDSISEVENLLNLPVLGIIDKIER